MRLVSVNVGQPRPDGDRRSKTGIYKEPVNDAFVGESGLDGDAVCDKKHHGGVDQAAYLYDVADYAWWSGEIGREIGAGTFGENLTMEGVSVDLLAIGDRLAIGEVELEVTSPRIPCATLARRMGDGGFVARYMAARRPGAYLRVLRPGRLAAGDPIVLRPYQGERVGVIELFDEFHAPKLEEGALRRILDAPIAQRLRTRKESQWAALKARIGN